MDLELNPLILFCEIVLNYNHQINSFDLQNILWFSYQELF